jgi:hypothetical protein
MDRWDVSKPYYVLYGDAWELLDNNMAVRAARTEHEHYSSALSMLSCSQSLCKKHNLMKGAAPLHEWMGMLETVEERLRFQKEERWQASVEGQAYHAAHPHAFFPRGWPHGWKVCHGLKVPLVLVQTGTEWPRRGMRAMSAARQRTRGMRRMPQGKIHVTEWERMQSESVCTCAVFPCLLWVLVFIGNHWGNWYL